MQNNSIILREVDYMMKKFYDIDYFLENDIDALISRVHFKHRTYQVF